MKKSRFTEVQVLRAGSSKAQGLSIHGLFIPGYGYFTSDLFN
jgi:hypothetical protein